MRMKGSIGGPVELQTNGSQRAFFEKYVARHEDGLADEDFEKVRQEIGAYYHVPLDHQYVISDDTLKQRQRTRRAFTVVILDNDERYYIEGRTPHAVLQRTLRATHHVDIDPEGDNFTSINGFLDPEGFPDVPMVQERAKMLEKIITWFVRYTVPSSSPHSPSSPSSPIEIDS